MLSSTPYFFKFSLYQERKHVQISIISSFKRFLRSVIGNLTDEKIYSYSTDINEIDKKSKTILEDKGNLVNELPIIIY